MKRENGLYYVKFLGVWFLAGKDLHSAYIYRGRLENVLYQGGFSITL